MRIGAEFQADKESDNEVRQDVMLEGGVELLVRNAVASDARALRETTQRTHAETDYLLSYPDEQSGDMNKRLARWWKRSAVTMRSSSSPSSMGRSWAALESRRWAAGARWLTGRVSGSAYSRSIGGLGIGRVLVESCIDCARRAGYVQLELEVVAGNERAVSLYRRAGFEEYGRNPRGYRSASSGYQELVHMRLEL